MRTQYSSTYPCSAAACHSCPCPSRRCTARGSSRQFWERCPSTALAAVSDRYFGENHSETKGGSEKEAEQMNNDPTPTQRPDRESKESFQHVALKLVAAERRFSEARRPKCITSANAARRACCVRFTLAKQSRYKITLQEATNAAVTSRHATTKRGQGKKRFHTYQR